MADMLAFSVPTTPTLFRWDEPWSGGPVERVQVAGDWDNWRGRIELLRQPDGSFSKELGLPSHSRVTYKFIINSEHWLISVREDTRPDGHGNINNTRTIGHTPPATVPEAILSGAPIKPNAHLPPLPESEVPLLPGAVVPASSKAESDRAKSSQEAIRGSYDAKSLRDAARSPIPGTGRDDDDDERATNVSSNPSLQPIPAATLVLPGTVVPAASQVGLTQAKFKEFAAPGQNPVVKDLSLAPIAKEEDSEPVLSSAPAQDLDTTSTLPGAVVPVADQAQTETGRVKQENDSKAPAGLQASQTSRTTENGAASVTAGTRAEASLSSSGDVAGVQGTKHVDHVPIEGGPTVGRVNGNALNGVTVNKDAFKTGVVTDASDVKDQPLVRGDASKAGKDANLSVDRNALKSRVDDNASITKDQTTSDQEAIKTGTGAELDANESQDAANTATGSIAAAASAAAGAIGALFGVGSAAAAGDQEDEKENKLEESKAKAEEAKEHVKDAGAAVADALPSTTEKAQADVKAESKPVLEQVKDTVASAGTAVKNTAADVTNVVLGVPGVEEDTSSSTALPASSTAVSVAGAAAGAIGAAVGAVVGFDMLRNAPQPVTAATVAAVGAAVGTGAVISSVVSSNKSKNTATPQSAVAESKKSAAEVAPASQPKAATKLEDVENSVPRDVTEVVADGPISDGAPSQPAEAKQTRFATQEELASTDTDEPATQPAQAAPIFVPAATPAHPAAIVVPATQPDQSAAVVAVITPRSSSKSLRSVPLAQSSEHAAPTIPAKAPAQSATVAALTAIPAPAIPSKVDVPAPSAVSATPFPATSTATPTVETAAPTTPGRQREPSSVSGTSTSKRSSIFGSIGRFGGSGSHSRVSSLSTGSGVATGAVSDTNGHARVVSSGGGIKSQGPSPLLTGSEFGTAPTSPILTSGGKTTKQPTATTTTSTGSPPSRLPASASKDLGGDGGGDESMRKRKKSLYRKVKQAFSSPSK